MGAGPGGAGLEVSQTHGPEQSLPFHFLLSTMRAYATPETPPDSDSQAPRAAIFPASSSPSTHELSTTVLPQTNKYIFGPFNNNRKSYNFDSFTLMALVVLAVVIFLFENLREKRSVSLAK